MRLTCSSIAAVDSGVPGNVDIRGGKGLGNGTMIKKDVVDWGITQRMGLGHNGKAKRTEIGVGAWRTRGQRGVFESAVVIGLGENKATRRSRSRTRSYVPFRSLKRASQARLADPRELSPRSRL